VRALFLLRPIAVVLAAAAAGAGAWVVSHDGFGAGDIAALLLWSLPLGVGVALASLAIRKTWQPSSSLLRVVVAAALGALLGSVWTLAIAWMMGPWFGTFSFPVLPILCMAGASAMVDSQLSQRGPGARPVA
jgi:hypothetical protein